MEISPWGYFGVYWSRGWPFSTPISVDSWRLMTRKSNWVLFPSVTSLPLNRSAHLSVRSLSSMPVKTTSWYPSRRLSADNKDLSLHNLLRLATKKEYFHSNNGPLPGGRIAAADDPSRVDRQARWSSVKMCYFLTSVWANSDRQGRQSFSKLDNDLNLATTQIHTRVVSGPQQVWVCATVQNL